MIKLHYIKLYLNIFFTGIDDAETECDLDDIDTWTLKVSNNNEDIEDILQQILELISIG